VSLLWSSDGGDGPIGPHYEYDGFAPTSTLAQMCSACSGDNDCGYLDEFDPRPGNWQLQDRAAAREKEAGS